MWIKDVKGNLFNPDYAVQIALHFTPSFNWEVTMIMDPRSTGVYGRREQSNQKVLLYSGKDEEEARIFYASTQGKLGINTDE